MRRSAIISITCTCDVHTFCRAVFLLPSTYPLSSSAPNSPANPHDDHYRYSLSTPTRENPSTVGMESLPKGPRARSPFLKLPEEFFLLFQEVHASQCKHRPNKLPSLATPLTLDVQKQIPYGEHRQHLVSHSRVMAIRGMEAFRPEF